MLPRSTFLSRLSLARSVTPAQAGLESSSYQQSCGMMQGDQDVTPILLEKLCDRTRIEGELPQLVQPSDRKGSVSHIQHGGNAIHASQVMVSGRPHTLAWQDVPMFDGIAKVLVRLLVFDRCTAFTSWHISLNTRGTLLTLQDKGDIDPGNYPA